ncbi:MAG: DUF4097 family beta strand repeat-containing protein [Acidobacteriia bacterium]|nr:DUF4097 family beta strand repeat-containing protein [Terriglobia bacterium]
MSVYSYRRGSIFWALTLIAIGGIFLYHNFNPTVRPWHIIAKYWPLIIIFWGVSKLIDYLQARAHPDTTPFPLFSVGEAILLFLVLCFGTMVSNVVLRPWQEWPAAFGIDLGDEDIAKLFLNPYTYTETLTQPAKPEAHLIIEDQRGDVEIHAGDQPVIEAIVKKTIRAEDEPAAKKLDNQLKVEIVEQAGAYLLRSNRRSLPEGGRWVRLDVVLRVPKETSTDLTAESGDLVVDGLKGNQNLTVLNGDVRATNLEGLVRIHKSGGSVVVREVKGNVDLDGRGRDVETTGVTGTVSVNGDFSGDVQFARVGQAILFLSSRTEMTAQKLAGRMNMELGSLDARGIDGPFEIATKQKDISLEDFKHSVKISTSNGDVRLQTSTPLTQPVTVEVNKGGIDLEVPAKGSFQVDASSQHGDVACDFPGLKVSKEGETPTISGTLGKGGPLVRLQTSYGTIHLKPYGAGTLAPPPNPPGTPAPPAHPALPADEAQKKITHALCPLPRLAHLRRLAPITPRQRALPPVN